MKNQSIPDMKRQSRYYFSNLRDNLSIERRLEGSLTCCEFLKQKLANSHYISSFASQGTEINLWEFNLTLCSEGRLVLPRVEGEVLAFYHVTNIEEGLVRSLKNIMEPNPNTCKRADMDEIDAIIVPGLSFDRKKYRIGYGMGHYDRVLAPLSDKLKLGVCFKEQVIDSLPIQAHDIPVDIVCPF